MSAYSSRSSSSSYEFSAMPTISGQSYPRVFHFGVEWQVVVFSSFAIIIICILTVVIYQFNRNRNNRRGIELGDSVRKGRMSPTSISKRRRKRKTRKRDVIVPEEIVDFEDDTAVLGMDVGTAADIKPT